MEKKDELKQFVFFWKITIYLWITWSIVKAWYIHYDGQKVNRLIVKYYMLLIFRKKAVHSLLNGLVRGREKILEVLFDVSYNIEDIFGVAVGCGLQLLNLRTGYSDKAPQSLAIAHSVRFGGFYPFRTK